MTARAGGIFTHCIGRCCSPCRFSPDFSEQDAHDVVQDAIIEVAKEMPTFRYDRTRGRFKGWLLTIVRRRLANFWCSKHCRHNGEQVPREKLAEPSAIGPNHVRTALGADAF